MQHFHAVCVTLQGHTHAIALLIWLVAPKGHNLHGLATELKSIHLMTYNNALDSSWSPYQYQISFNVQLYLNYMDYPQERII